MSREPSKTLVVMTRYPQPGRAKTRLIPALGPEGAASLQRRLTERVLTQARRLALSQQVRIVARFAGGSEPQMRSWLGPGPEYLGQGEGDLGQRMARAFKEAFAGGARQVVLVGSDIPGLDEQVMARAFSALERHQVVLGPAVDGGYYLIGLSRPAPELFTKMPWGGNQVLQATLRLTGELGLSLALLEKLGDLDRPPDLNIWRAIEQAEAGSISVIIPALNEQERISAAVASARQGRPMEVIVVDGGSRDATSRAARQAGALVVSSPPGRARQMNAGAALATGQYLLFLHADTLLPPGWQDQVRRLLAEPGVALGAFTFRLDRRSAGLRFIELAVALRCRLAGLPYGDQALFLRRNLFRQLGGYRPLPIMEDCELVRACRAHGRVALSPLPAVTSARRWQRAGLGRTTLINYLVPLAFYLGFPPQRLRRLYDRAVRRDPPGGSGPA